MAPRSVRRGPAHLPMASEVEWGWTLVGGENESQTTMTAHLVNFDDKRLTTLLEKIWEIDFIYIQYIVYGCLNQLRLICDYLAL